MTASERKKIIAFFENNEGVWSYQLIADHFGITRCALAGILFRHRHPYAVRVSSGKTKWRSQIGTGRKPIGSYYPKLHAMNTR